MTTAKTQMPEGWNEYRKLVVSQLEKLNHDLIMVSDKIDSLRNDEISKLQIQVATLKAQAALIGGMAGLIFTLLVKFFPQ